MTSGSLDTRLESRLETPGEAGPSPNPQISLVDLLDRLLGVGVVLAGDVVISLAGVDLVQVKLHALISSVREDMADPMQRRRGAGSGGASGE